MLLLLSAIFLGLAVGVFALSLAFDQRRDRARVLRERLEAIEVAARRDPRPELSILRDELLSEIPTLHELLTRWRWISRLQRFLEQADINIRAGKFLLLSAFLGASIAFLMAFMSVAPSFCLLLGGTAALVPWMVVGVRRSRRFQAFEERFPEAIDFLGRAVRAGHAFSTALELIADEMPEPVSGEFRRVFEEQKFGLPTRDALLNFADRVPMVDVKFFVTSVLLQRETGGNLAEILDKLSYVIRERFKIMRQVRVFTAQGRLTFMILMALPPIVLLLMFLVNREIVLPLFTEKVGQRILQTAFGLQLVGWYWLRRIIRIEV